jgi:hypothetical protein
MRGRLAGLLECVRLLRGNDILLGLELVHLLDMNGKTSGGVQASWAQVAFEMLGLLVLH